MTSNPAPAAPPTGPEVPSVAAAAGALATAVDELAAAERSICTAVLALSETIGTGICETVERLPPDLLLANLCRLIRSDRSTILTAADVLRFLPITTGLWRDGVLSWGQVRTIALSAARLRAGDREGLDRRIGESARDHGLDAYGPDGLLDAVDRAVWDLQSVAEAERAEERREEADFVSLQAAFDGGVKVYGEYYGAVRGAKITNAFLDAAPPVDPHLSRGQRFAIALECMAENQLAGGSDRPARPLLDVFVDLTQVTPNAAGTVDLHVDGPLATLTARTVEALTEDADLRVTLFDGERPLATSAKRKAEDTPTDVRRSVAFRDRGDRMPGSRAPIAWTDVHHIRERRRGGDHDPDNLASLRSRWHQLLHRQKWRTRLDPVTGRFTIERAGRSYHSLPKGTPLSPDPGPDPPVDDHGDPLPF